jgi:hypothetical protein
MQFALNHKVIRVLDSSAAGAATVTGPSVNMMDFEGVVFIVQFGPITGGAPGVKAQGGQLANGSDAADLAGTDTADNLPYPTSNQCVVLDVYRPEFPFITPVVTGAADAAINSVIAILYGPRSKPTANDPITVATTNAVVSPALGTA